MTTKTDSQKPNDDAKPATLDSTITAVSQTITIHAAYTLTDAILSALEYDTGHQYEEFPFAFQDGQMLLIMVTDRPAETPDGFHIFEE